LSCGAISVYIRHAACEVVSVSEEHMRSVTVMSDFEDEVRCPVVVCAAACVCACELCVKSDLQE
jgi:maleate cis-trans isomerase